LGRQGAGPRPLREANPRVGRSVARLLERCLAFEPEHRPRSAAEAAAVLRQYLARSRRLRRWVARHALALVAAVALLLVAGLGFALRLPSLAATDWLERGLECYRHGDYERAVEHFSRGLEADPGSSSALFARGRAYQLQGLWVQALESYRLADRLAPDGPT